MNTILAPVDFSDVTSHVVETAQQLACAFHSRIVLLNVAEPEPDFVGFEPGPTTVRLAVARDLKADGKLLHELKERLAQGDLEVDALHLQGPAVEKILQEADSQHASWIVMGSHGHGALYEFVVGTVTNGVMKNARCPVVVVPAERPK